MSARRNWPWDGLGLAVLGVLYGLTVSRDLGVIDSGELATVCATLGVAHPTGYPLYSLIGKAFLSIWPGSAILGMNVLSAVFAVAASALLLHESRAWIRQLSAGPAALNGRGQRARRSRAREGGGLEVGRDDPSGRLEAWIPRFLALSFGVSGLLWSQATTNEVYSLHAFLAVAILGCALRLASGQLTDRTLLLLAWCLGLAGGHHLSIVFLGPAVLMATVYALRLWPERRAHSFGGALICLVLGLSVVLYLPVRSAAEPILDWGNPETWATFKRHLLASQYSVWHFQSSDRFLSNLGGYFTRLPWDLGWVFLILVPVGIHAARTAWRPMFVLLLAAVTTLVWASGYEILDLEPYYLPADIAFLFLAGAGLFGVFRRSAPPWRAVGWIFVAVTLTQGVIRFPEQDRSADRLVRFHLETSLETTPPDAVVLSAFWDAFVSPSIYIQEVERTRRDLTIVDPELLRRSWYFEQLRRWDPELLRPMEPLVEDFLGYLAAFEEDRPYDPQQIEVRYRAIIEEIAHAHRPSRPTAFTADLTPDFARSLSPVPEGLVYVLRDDPSTSPKLNPPSTEGLVAAGFDPDDRIHQYVHEFWVRMVRNRVAYLNAFGRAEEIPAWEAELSKLRALVQGRDEDG